MRLIDSHCHLEYEGVAEDREGVLARAREAGVTGMLNISTRRSEWETVVGTAEREPDVWASVGIHPHEADQHADLGRDVLLAATEHPRVIGIGETGLDYYYDKSDRGVQRDLFRMHIGVARETGLSVIIHTRDAESDTLAILGDEMEKGAFPALIHCFTASRDFAKSVLELGLTISLSGIVTFKNARELQEIAADLPSDRLLVETDSPFLAPVPHRGRPCEPAFVRDTAAFVADLRRVPLEDLAEIDECQLLQPVHESAGVKLIMLGSGTSTGVPRIGEDWGECDPAEPRNRRTRVSIVVENAEGKRLLVDTSTDLRQQLLVNRIERVDGVFWTHDHADHCHGIDDLRVMRYDRSGPLPGFAADETARRLRARFSYVFAGEHGYPTICELSTLERLRIFAGFRHRPLPDASRTSAIHRISVRFRR